MAFPWPPGPVPHPSSPAWFTALHYPGFRRAPCGHHAQVWLGHSALTILFAPLPEISMAASLSSFMFKCKFLSGHTLTTSLENVQPPPALLFPSLALFFFIIFIAVSHIILHIYFIYCHPQVGCKLPKGIGFHLLCSLAHGRHSINNCRRKNEVCTLGILKCSEEIHMY